MLNNPNPESGDWFGYAVATSGNTVAVTAPFDDTRATNVGSAYVYDLTATTPNVPTFTISGPNTPNNSGPSSGDNFGARVAISGSHMVVGRYAPADSLVSVNIYDLAGATPTVPIFTLDNPSPAFYDYFGSSVAISGTRVVVGDSGNSVGALYAGSAYVYDLSGATPTVPVATLNNPTPAADDLFGNSVSVSGTRVVVGAMRDDTGSIDAGSAYVYDLGSATPTVPVATLNNPSPAAYDFFGTSVAVSGTRVVVGAEQDNTGGSAYVYDLASGNPTVPVATLNNPSASASFDHFGKSVAVSGTRVVVGAYNTDNGGSVYAYDLGGATPTAPVATLNNPSPSAGDLFGISLAVSGTRVVVGSSHDDAGFIDAGSAYVYDLDSAAPTLPMATLSNPSPSAGDLFGNSVSFDGSIVAIGAPRDDSIAIDKGAAYIFGPESLAPASNQFSARHENADTDGDGTPDVEERLVGTNPRHPASKPGVVQVTHNHSGSTTDGTAPLTTPVFNAPGTNMQISALTRQGSGVEFQFQTAAGATYRLEGTNDLGSREWTVLIERVDGTGEVLRLFDPDTTGFLQYFYRFIRLPSAPAPQRP